MRVDYEGIRRDNIRKYGEETAHLEILRALYNKRTHFIYELLQNADDAEARRVLFEVGPTSFRCRHDGRLFDEEDVIGISAVCNSTKTSNLNKIGKFGIGFKSVYNYTRTPEVHSGQEHFRIEHYVRPHQIEPKIDMAGYGTSFVLPFNAEIDAATARSEIGRELESLRARNLLFLNHLDRVDFRLADGPLVSLSRQIDEQGAHRFSTVLRESEGATSVEEWVLFHRTVTREGAAGENRVQIAFKLSANGKPENRRVEQLSSPPLYVSFPTEKRMQLGCIVQGPFRTNPARDNVSDTDDWNIHLAGETAQLFVETLPKLRELGLLTPELLQALPIQRSAFPDGSLFEPLFSSVKQALGTQPLLPADDGTYIAGSFARLASSEEVRRLIDASQFSEINAGTEAVKWLSGEISAKRTPVLRGFLVEELDVKEIKGDRLAEMLTDEFLEVQDDEWMTRLYQFLLYRERLWSDRVRGPAGAMRNRKFIRLQCGRHVAPFDEKGSPNAYLPSELRSTFPIVKQSIDSDMIAGDFLRKLGLTEPDLTDEVLLGVLPKYENAAGTDPTDHEAYLEDLSQIVSSLQQSDRMSVEKWNRLKTRIQETPFLLAENTNGCTGLERPGAIYQRLPELFAYFSGNDQARFMVSNVAEQVEPVLSILGIASLPRLREFTPVLSDLQLAELRDGQKSTREETVVDYDLDGLGQLLLEIQNCSPPLAHAKAVSLWNLLDRIYTSDNGRRWEGEHRWYFRIEKTRAFPARFVKILRAERWLPTTSGAVCRPTEISLHDLPAGFSPHEKIIEALRFQSSELEIAERTAEALKPFGVTPDDLQTILENPEGFQRWRETRQRSRSEEPFPERPTANPERRDQKVAEEILTAPEKKFELTNRSVRVSKVGLDAKTWLRQQYTDDSGMMYCQMTQEVMPFRKRNGQHYFEAVEISQDFGKEHRAIYLALSPVAAAQYKEFVKSDADTMFSFCEAIRATTGNTIPLQLGDERVIVRFTDQHARDLRTVLAQLAPRPVPAPTVAGPIDCPIAIETT